MPASARRSRSSSAAATLRCCPAAHPAAAAAPPPRVPGPSRTLKTSPTTSTAAGPRWHSGPGPRGSSWRRPGPRSARPADPTASGRSRLRVARPPAPATARGSRARRRSASPARRAPQPSRQPLVVLPEMLVQRGPQARRHWRARTGVPRRERGVAEVWQAEELEHSVVLRPRVVEEVAAVDDVNPVATEGALKALELVGIVTAGAVGIQPVIAAGVGRVAGQALGLTLDPGILQLPGPLERIGFPAEVHLVGVLRVGPLDRVAH